MSKTYLIEWPDHFAPTKQWQEFLAAMQRLDQTSPQVQASTAAAKRELARRAA